MSVRTWYMLAGIWMLGVAHTGHAQQVAVSQVHNTVSAAEGMLNRRVTVHVKQVPLERAIKAVADAADVPVLYRVDAIDRYTKPVTVEAVNTPLRVVFAEVLAGTGLRLVPNTQTSFVIQEGPVVLSIATGVIVGRVVDAKTKQPVAGATVTLNNATQGVTTAADGTFRLSANAGEHTVSVRALGKARQAQRVTVQDGVSASLEFLLESNASVLNEVVVTGTVVATERKEISTPITVITAKDIEQRGVTTIVELLRGEVPGVVALDPGTQTYVDRLGFNVNALVYARGASSLTGGTSPLKVYVDGVELADPAHIGTIDVQSISHMEIITGPQAATVYGSGAMGGVMQIFTKKGVANTQTVTVSMRYGMLENNFSKGLTPTHNDALNINGGSGPGFSYALSGSYNYSGQWQPALFARSYGASVGVTHSNGPFTLDGSVAVRTGKNGTFGGNVSFCGFNQVNTGCVNSPFYQRYLSDGSSTPGNMATTVTQRVSTVSSQTQSLNADYRVTSIWQHHLTVGRTQTQSKLMPDAPRFSTPSDTVYQATRSMSERYTTSYNTTFIPRFGSTAVTATFGANRAWGDGSSITGCLANANGLTYVKCYDNGTVTASQPSTDQNWGGFGSVRLGLFEQLFLNAAVRGERSRNYGQNYRTNWTPTFGAAYTMEYHDLTFKILGSYGRSTRPPAPEWRDGVQQYRPPPLLPASYWTQVPNPELRPEYSAGPQGGFELYYGNLGSLTINRYSQTISDLIQQVIMDTVFFTDPNNPSSCCSYTFSQQYQNVAKIKQQGWEATGSMNVRAFFVRGTYSWTDSRVKEVSTLPSFFNFQVGSVFTYVPSHTGSITVGYAYGGTNISIQTNWIGASVQSGGTSEYQLINLANSRIRSYSPHVTGYPSSLGVEGNAKSNLSATQRLTPWATATVNVSNLTNNFGSSLGALYPTLGRTTSFGMSMRLR